MREHVLAWSILSVLFAAVLIPAPGSAWEVKVEEVDQRIRQASGLWQDKKGALSARSVARHARQGKKPGWAKKAGDAFQRVYWSESYGGKTYYFGVGLAEKIKNPALRLTAAQDRARASLVHMLGTVQTTTEKTPSGGTLTTTEAQGLVAGAVPVDWYAGKGGALYVLLVVAR